MGATTAFDLFQMTPLASASGDLVIPVLKKMYELASTPLVMVERPTIVFFRPQLSVFCMIDE
jgi:hypothetical protein